MRNRMLPYLALLASLVLAGCEKAKDVSSPDENPPPDETTPVPDSLAFAAILPLLADGVDEATIYAVVVDEQGKGLNGIGVAFSTSHGTIEPFSTTDTRGRAAAVLTSAASVEDLTARVTAEVQTDKSRAPVPAGARILLSAAPPEAEDLSRAVAGARAQAASLRAAADVLLRGVTLALSVNPSILQADGIAAAEVGATLRETTRRVPLAEREIRFSATQGVIEGSAQTDISGVATAALRARPGETAATLTAYFGPGLTAQASAQFSAVRMSLEAGAEAIVADGVSSTSVIARLSNQQGNPVAGALVVFSTTAGTITSPETTDAQGAATATLQAAATPGTAEVTAGFGGAISEEVEVAFVVPPVVAAVILEVDPESLPADGVSGARLIARAFDAENQSVADGTRLEFSVTGSGRVIHPVAFTAGGTAESEYVAGSTTGLETLRVTANGVFATATLRLVPLGADAIALAAQATSVLADGFASTLLTATVTDRFGHPLPAGLDVAFRTTLGLIEDVVPTDGAGRATARLRATRFRTGPARVTASVGEVAAVADVAFVSETAAHIEAVSVEPASIGVRGASDHETATLTFEVQDRHGIPVDADHAVTLAFAIEPLGGSGPTDATVYPATARTNEDGLAATAVNSGIVSGAVGVEAVSGTLSSEPIRVAIHGDKPDPNHFSIAFDKLNIAGLVYYGILDPVTAFVGDQHGNPVPDSTIVWFTSAFGMIEGSAGTDDHGRATVDHMSAGPAPLIPGGDGLVEICAQTVSKTGERIEVCGDVMWSGPTILEILEPAPDFTIDNGGAITITFRLRDANFNPLVGGTRVAVTSTRGTLGGATDFLLPDTQDPAYTTFACTLSDDAPEESELGAVTVTIEVTSQNGNGSVSITGTMN